MSTHLAIIGTAGRRSDQGKLTSAHYKRMGDAVLRLAAHKEIDLRDLHLYSGGAAWADHVAVGFVLRGLVRPEYLHLYLPAPLGEDGFYSEGDPLQESAASTANYYHKLFSVTRQVNTIHELNTVRSRGAQFEVIPGGFFARNSLVAKAVSPNGYLLAFTFGNQTIQQSSWTIREFSGKTKAKDAGLNDGGSADTWNKCRAQSKFHCLLGPMESSELSV